MKNTKEPVLCIDVGNTHTHCAVLEQNSSHVFPVFKTSLWNKNVDEIKLILESELKRFPEIKKCSFCSVVPSLNLHLIDLLEQLGFEIFQLTNTTCPLQINYPNADEIGHDRLANAIAAYEICANAVIVIDLGTAVTFDIISSTGVYEGGVIAPGLSSLTEYLHEKTALLPKLSAEDLELNGNIGKSTKDAMQIGFVLGFSGMIDSILKGINSELKNAPSNPVSVISTGGDAKYLKLVLPEDINHHSDLTMRGLYSAISRKPSTD